MGEAVLQAPVRPAFASPAAREEYFAAYAAVLDRWPVPVESLDVPSAYGRTHVHVAGPIGAPPLLLLHGGGATGTVWFNNVGDLSRQHRVYAIDQIGDAGRSVHDGLALRGAADFTAWLNALLDALDVPAAAVLGHSYGAWLALTYALNAPQRVRRLILLDPTGCVAGMKLTYRLRAVPLFVRPSPRVMRDFLEWETGHAPLDPDWLHLISLAGDVRGSKLVLPRRPGAAELGNLTVPTLVLLAERSRTLDVGRAARNTERLLPSATVAVLPGATHHTLPTMNADQLNRKILQHLG